MAGPAAGHGEPHVGWDGMGWDGRVHGRAMGPKRAPQVVMRELWDDAGQGGWRVVG